MIMTRRRAEHAVRWMQELFPEALYCPDLKKPFVAKLELYFAGQQVRLTGTLDLGNLTDFQKDVLQACREIPYGETATYADLARAIKRPRSARAVGSALAQNPLPLVIPCHRVVKSNGQPGGYSAEQGASMKRWLLDLERKGLARAQG
jgi:methylated-DNA-[protein]-cysteine S-methyltransferase